MAATRTQEETRCRRSKPRLKQEQNGADQQRAPTMKEADSNFSSGSSGYISIIQQRAPSLASLRQHGGGARQIMRVAAPVVPTAMIDDFKHDNNPAPSTTINRRHRHLIHDLSRQQSSAAAAAAAGCQLHQWPAAHQSHHWRHPHSHSCDHHHWHHHYEGDDNNSHGDTTQDDADEHEDQVQHELECADSSQRQQLHWPEEKSLLARQRLVSSLIGANRQSDQQLHYLASSSHFHQLDHRRHAHPQTIKSNFLHFHYDNVAHDNQSRPIYFDPNLTSPHLQPQEQQQQQQQRHLSQSSGQLNHRPKNQLDPNNNNSQRDIFSPSSTRLRPPGSSMQPSLSRHNLAPTSDTNKHKQQSHHHHTNNHHSHRPLGSSSTAKKSASVMMLAANQRNQVANSQNSNGRDSPPPLDSAGGQQHKLAPTELGCCAKFAKLLLFLVNCLFWLSGVALGAWGILALVEDHKYNLSQLLVFDSSTRMSLFQLLSWSFITLGCATVLVGLCGCSAMVKNNRWILGLYIFLILAIFALDLATGLLAIIFQERLVANVRLRLVSKLRNEYGSQASFTSAIDYIQTKFECCGLDGHLDYEQSLWRLQRLGGFEATVARTCCHLRNTFDDQAHVNPRPVNESMCQSTDVRFHQSYRYRRGCLDDLERLIRHKIWTFTLGCGAVGAVILLSLLFATCFCRSIPSNSSQKQDQRHSQSSKMPREFPPKHRKHHVVTHNTNYIR